VRVNHMTTRPPASSPDQRTRCESPATRDTERPGQQPQAEQPGESGVGGFLSPDATTAEIAVRAIAVSDSNDFGRSLGEWWYWCRAIAKAANFGDRERVLMLVGKLDRRVV